MRPRVVIAALFRLEPFREWRLRLSFSATAYEVVEVSRSGSFMERLTLFDPEALLPSYSLFGRSVSFAERKRGVAS